MDIRGHARIAEGAQQDGVEIAFQHGEAVGRDRDAVSQVAVGAPVEMGQLDVGARGLDDVHGLGDDLGADAVPGNNGDSLLLAHGLEDYQLGRRLSFFCGFTWKTLKSNAGRPYVRRHGVIPCSPTACRDAQFAP